MMCKVDDSLGSFELKLRAVGPNFSGLSDPHLRQAELSNLNFYSVQNLARKFGKC